MGWQGQEADHRRQAASLLDSSHSIERCFQSHSIVTDSRAVERCRSVEEVGLLRAASRHHPIHSIEDY